MTAKRPPKKAPAEAGAVRGFTNAPQYRIHTEGLLGNLRRARGSAPYNKLPDWRFNELVECAERAVESAKELESSVPHDPLAEEAYRARCDAARTAIRTAHDEPLARAGHSLAKGGSKGRKNRPPPAWHAEAVAHAKVLLATGHMKHELAFLTGLRFKRSDDAVRTVLQAAGLVQRRITRA